MMFESRINRKASMSMENIKLIKVELLLNLNMNSLKPFMNPPKETTQPTSGVGGRHIL